MKFHPIDVKSADWKRLDGFADRTVFQTREWLRFVAESQNAQPVLAELREASDVLGYFTGLTFSKFGMKVLGSSFPGWTTPYIGFNLNPGVPRRGARKVCLGRSEVPASRSLGSEFHFRRRRDRGIQGRILCLLPHRPDPLGRRI